jgi:hypothetical protein
MIRRAGHVQPVNVQKSGSGGKMRMVIFGGSGMVGQGVLRECLRDPQVEQVVSVVRAPTGAAHQKLREIVHRDFLNFTPIENESTGLNACLYCLGVTSTGTTEENYARITYEFTIAAATTLLKMNPGMSFVFVSGRGADSTERGSTMWARVKGKTENALLALPFRAVYVFRPAMIQPLDGIKSKTDSYRIMYSLTNPFLGAARYFWPSYVSTTQELGKSLLASAKHGTEKRVIEAGEIRTLLESWSKTSVSQLIQSQTAIMRKRLQNRMYVYQAGTRSRALSDV